MEQKSLGRTEEILKSPMNVFFPFWHYITFAYTNPNVSLLLLYGTAINFHLLSAEWVPSCCHYDKK